MLDCPQSETNGILRIMYWYKNLRNRLYDFCTLLKMNCKQTFWTVLFSTNEIQYKMKFSYAALFLFVLFFSELVAAWGNNRTTGQTRNILVVGFANNVLSDFFPKVSLAENINVAPDQFDAMLHRKLVSGFGSLPNGTHNFIVVEDYVKTLQIRQMLHLKGEKPELHTDPSSSGTQALKQIMQQYQADYLLVFRQYHFKWQDEPFNSLFHILNYSVLA